MRDYGFPDDWYEEEGGGDIFLWKDRCKEFIIETVEKERNVQKYFFLASIKVFKFSQTKAPEMVREILCESNLEPAADYGPSVVFYNKCMYYFKRLVASKDG